MASLLVTLLCFGFGILQGNSLALLKTTWVEDTCRGSQVHVIDLGAQATGILVSRRTSTPLNCSLLLVPRSGASVVLSFKKYALGQGDHLTLRDAADSHEIALLDSASFPDERRSMVSSGALLIRYHRLTDVANFQFTFTQVFRSPCSSDEFQCTNDLCVPSEMKCDGHNHCGDNSDQRKCDGSLEDPALLSGTRRSSAPWIAGIVVGALALVGVVVGFGVGIAVRRRRKARKEKDDPPPPPPRTLQPQRRTEVPPMYPQLGGAPADNPAFQLQEEQAQKRSAAPPPCPPLPQVHSAPAQEARMPEVPSLYPQLPPLDDAPGQNPASH